MELTTGKVLVSTGYCAITGRIYSQAILVQERPGQPHRPRAWAVVSNPPERLEFHRRYFDSLRAAADYPRKDGQPLLLAEVRRHLALSPRRDAA